MGYVSHLLAVPCQVSSDVGNLDPFFFSVFKEILKAGGRIKNREFIAFVVGYQVNSISCSILGWDSLGGLTSSPPFSSPPDTSPAWSCAALQRDGLFLS